MIMALIHGFAKPVEARCSHRSLLAGFWLDVGESVGRFSKIKRHLTAQQAAETGYLAAWHLGNQKTSLLVTSQLTRFKGKVKSFAKQYAEMASTAQDCQGRCQLSARGFLPGKCPSGPHGRTSPVSFSGLAGTPVVKPAQCLG